MGKTFRMAAYAALIVGLPVIRVVSPARWDARSELDYYLMLFGALLACAAALNAMRRHDYDRRALACLAFGLALWAAGMILAIVATSTEQNFIGSYVLFLGYGAPLLYAAVRSRDEPLVLSRRVLDGALLILLVILSYLGMRNLADSHGILREENTVWMVIAFDIENALLVATYVLRLLTATDEKDYRFFRLMTVFLIAFAVAIGIHNHDELYPHVSMWVQLVAGVLPTVPFMLLACLLHADSKPTPFRATVHPAARRISLSIGPALLLAAIFALSLLIHDTASAFGQIMLAATMVVFVLRVTQTQYWLVATRDQLTDALATVERLSLLDELTGVPNRRALEQAIHERVAESRRDKRPLSCLMIDIDHFKAFNDTRGHPEGDAALRAVARLLAGSLRRPPDFIARYGGEEFVVLLPNTDADGAQTVAQRINRAVYDAHLEHTHGIDTRVTVSVGVATCPGLSTSAEDLVSQADRALYTAKRAGRDCVATLPDTTFSVPLAVDVHP